MNEKSIPAEIYIALKRVVQEINPQHANGHYGLEQFGEAESDLPGLLLFALWYLHSHEGNTGIENVFSTLYTYRPKLTADLNAIKAFLSRADFSWAALLPSAEVLEKTLGTIDEKSTQWGFVAAAVHEIGWRPNNQDGYVLRLKNGTLLIAVLDGVGGHQHGERIVAQLQTELELFDGPFTQEAIDFLIYSFIQRNSEGVGKYPATTLALILFTPDGQLYVLNIGDSTAAAIVPSEKITTMQGDVMWNIVAKKHRDPQGGLTAVIGMPPLAATEKKRVELGKPPLNRYGGSVTLPPHDRLVLAAYTDGFDTLERKIGVDYLLALMTDSALSVALRVTLFNILAALLGIEYGDNRTLVLAEVTRQKER